MNNEIIIKKLTKALEINKKEEKIEIIEITIKVKLLDKNITLTLSNSDFQILSNYKNEMEIINKQLLEIKSNYSGNQEYLGFLEKIPMEIEAIQETLIKIRDNASGAKKAVLDLESRINTKPADDFDIVHEVSENIFQNIDAEPTIDELIHHCKEIKDKAVNFIRIFNPVLSNKPVISKIKKTLEKNENIISNVKEETPEIIEILIKLKVSEKVILLSLSNTDFQILSNYKDELETLYKQLTRLQSTDSETDVSQHVLNEMRENIIGARNSVTEIEKRMIRTTIINKE